MASAVNPLTSSSTTSAAATSAASALGGKAPSEAMFLQLLVAQLQNQDPLNPTDSTQFVSQLAQFSELEQVIAIRGDIETTASNTAAANTAAANAAASTTPAAGSATDTSKTSS